MGYVKRIFCDKHNPRGWRILRLYDHCEGRARLAFHRFQMPDHDMQRKRQSRLRMELLTMLEK